MSWTATLCVVHAASDDPTDLRQCLTREGRRILTWRLPDAAPAGALQSDLVVVSEALCAASDPGTGPFDKGNRPKGLTLALGTAAASWADAALNARGDGKAIDARAGALLRLVRIEAECRARSITLEALGAGPIDEKGLKPPVSARVLHIGGPTMAFAGLHAQLAQHNIELRPVLSAGLALDEMETGIVDAVVLDASASERTARELSLIMRRNSDLALCPVLILESKELERRRPALVGDLIRIGDEPTTITVRLRQLIAENRRRRRALLLLRRSKTKGHHDARTGLHTSAFVRAHIASLTAEAERTGRIFTVGALRFTPFDAVLTADDTVNLAQQTGSLVARLIRAEDSAAAMSDVSIVLVFPSTTEAEAHLALRRIAAVLTATRFNASRHVEGIASLIEWTVNAPDPARGGDGLFADLEHGLDRHLRPAV